MSVNYIHIPLGLNDLLILFGTDRQVRRTVMRIERKSS